MYPAVVGRYRGYPSQKNTYCMRRYNNSSSRFLSTHKPKDAHALASWCILCASCVILVGCAMQVGYGVRVSKTDNLLRAEIASKVSRIALIRSSPIRIPFADRIWPKYFTSLGPNCTLEGFKVSRLFSAPSRAANNFLRSTPSSSLFLIQQG